MREKARARTLEAARALNDEDFRLAVPLRPQPKPDTRPRWRRLLGR